MNAEVIAIREPAAPKRTRAKPSPAPKMSAKTVRRTRLQHWSAMLLGTVASAMTIVSLTHVAGGVQHLTHGVVPDWQAWGLAVGLDINYVAMEMAGLVAAVQHVRARLHKLTKIGIPAVMGFSMALNALEFSAGVTNAYELAASVAMGLTLPALVFLTFRVAAVLADV